MEKHKSPNIRNGVSVIQPPRNLQGQSQVAPKRQPPPPPPPPQPPMAHQNRANLPMIPPFNNRVASNIPSTSQVALDLTQKSQVHQIPEQSTSSQMASKECLCPNCMKMKCIKPSNPPPPPPPTVTPTAEELQKVKAELEECYKRLLEKEVKIKDLTNLAEGQGCEMGKIHDQLNWHKVANKDLEDTVTKLLGEIVRLNDVVAEKNRALLDYQKTMEECTALCEKMQDNNTLLEEKLKETGEFMKKFNGDFKGGYCGLSWEYCECSFEQLQLMGVEGEDQVENGNGIEIQEIIEEMEVEKDKNVEGQTSGLEEIVEMGVQEIEQIEGSGCGGGDGSGCGGGDEIGCGGGDGIGSGGGELPLPPHDSQSEDEEWSIVTSPEGEHEKDGELDNGDMFEDVLMGLDIPSPFLFPTNEEIVETSVSVEEVGLPDDDKICLKRPAVEDGDEGEVDDEGGIKKARNDFDDDGMANTVCELLGGNDMQMDEDLGGQITLHYVESFEDAVDEDVVMTEVVEKQVEDVMDEVSSSSSSSSGELKEEYFEDDGICSKIFCEKCYTPFPNQMKMDQHYAMEKSCASGGDKRDDNGGGTEEECKSEESDFDNDEDEDELLDV